MSAEAETWQNFYVMAGGAAAALTGLVLVAVSLHLRAILSHPLFRDRAFTSLQGLVSILLWSAAVLAPQPLVALGLEVLVLGLIFATRLAQFIGLFRGVRSSRGSRRGLDRGPLWLVDWVGWILWIVALLLSGSALLLGSPAGFYALAFATVSGFVLIVWNAWVLLAEVAE